MDDLIDREMQQRGERIKKPPIRCRIIHKLVTYGYTKSGKHCKWHLHPPKDVTKCYICKWAELRT